MACNTCQQHINDDEPQPMAMQTSTSMPLPPPSAARPRSTPPSGSVDTFEGFKITFNAPYRWQRGHFTFKAGALKMAAWAQAGC